MRLHKIGTHMIDDQQRTEITQCLGHLVGGADEISGIPQNLFITNIYEDWVCPALLKMNGLHSSSLNCRFPVLRTIDLRVLRDTK